MIGDIINGSINNLLNRIDVLPQEKKDLISMRLKTCKECDLIKFDNITQSLRCGVCNCFIQWKTSCINCKCPKDKW